MELLLETKSADFLREVFCVPVSQEETGETIVPDSLPDAGRILQACGSVVLRNKDYRSGSVSISGGIHAGVLYLPEDQGAPRALHLYLPFTVRVEHPAATENTRAAVDLRVSSVDARILNSRKVLVRVGLSGTVTGYEPACQELSVGAPEEAADLQLRTAAYQVVRALEYAEKPFQMAEEAELPAGRAPMRELCQYQADVEVVESKLAGSKGLFKGNVALKLLYLTEEEELAAWTCQLPFSQFVDLEHEYGDDEELETVIQLTDFGVEDANGQGRRLLVNLQLLAQCTVVGRETVEVIEDVYSLYHDFTPQWRQVEAAGRLDRQKLTETFRAQTPASVQEILDTRVSLGNPVARREGETVSVTLPASATVLYRDEEGELQSAALRLEAACSTEAAENVVCRPSAALSGEAFAVPSGDGLEVRCNVAFTLDTFSQQSFRTLAGGQLSDERLDTSDRPSVILRTVGEGDTLWSLAKGCRTTLEAICAANNLEEGAELSGMILIPVMK